MSNMRDFEISKSKIHGSGIIVNKYIPRGTILFDAMEYLFGIIPVTTNYGACINHSWNPTYVLKYSENRGKWIIVTLVDHYPRNEVTMDYRETPWYVLGPSRRWK